MTHKPSDDDPIDLRSLMQEPADRESAFVAGVMARVAALPAAAVPVVGPLWGIWSMARWLTAAGIALAVVLAAARVWEIRYYRRGPATVAESLGVPPDLLPFGDRSGESR